MISGVATIDEVRTYWERHIHDLEITKHPVGSRRFFDDLDHYHFEKLHHLLRLVDFNAYAGKAVLEVGCGAAVDLVRFAKGAAHVTGVDVAASAIDLARANFSQQGLAGDVFVANAEAFPLPDASFDLVTRTASCNTPRTPAGSSTNASACSSPAARRSFRCTTASPG